MLLASLCFRAAQITCFLTTTIITTIIITTITGSIDGLFFQTHHGVESRVPVGAGLRRLGGWLVQHGQREAGKAVLAQAFHLDPEPMRAAARQHREPAPTQTKKELRRVLTNSNRGVLPAN
jgi:type IV secretory pathway VirJ component